MNNVVSGKLRALLNQAHAWDEADWPSDAELATWCRAVDPLLRMTLDMPSYPYGNFQGFRFDAEQFHPDLEGLDFGAQRRVRLANCVHAVAVAIEKLDREDQREIEARAFALENGLIYTDSGELKLPEQAEPTIFLVHGHDGEAKHEVARFVEQIAAPKVAILSEKSSGGRTVIEKFEAHAGRAVYAIVLLTPDDLGRAKAAEEDEPRARQNVVFELGYFFGKLGRQRVAVVNRGVELGGFSDIAGLVYLDYPDANWKVDLANELEDAGIKIDRNMLR